MLLKGAPDPGETCDCCKKEFTAKPCLDHDHDTLVFRGWLCHECNLGIGKLGDNLVGVLNAVNYLKKTNVQQEKEG